jgi:hypothetical protein
MPEPQAPANVPGVACVLSSLARTNPLTFPRLPLSLFFLDSLFTHARTHYQLHARTCASRPSERADTNANIFGGTAGGVPAHGRGI